MNLRIKQDSGWKTAHWVFRPYYWNILFWLILIFVSLMSLAITNGGDDDMDLKGAWKEIFEVMGWLPERERNKKYVL